MRSRFLACLGLAITSFACGGSDSGSTTGADAASEAGADSTHETATDSGADSDATDAGESDGAVCDLTGTWTGTITYPLAGCGGASPSDHPITLTLTQSGTSITGTGSDGTTILGTLLDTHLDLSTKVGTNTGDYVGDVDAACGAITGHWSDSLECDSGPFELHRP